MNQTDYTNPETIDIDIVIGEINRAFTNRGTLWDNKPMWPHVTVKALVNEIAWLKGEADPVLADVAEERLRQDVKFGEQNHGPEWWLIIALEELGEAGEVVVQLGLGDPDPKGFVWADYRKEMVQVAAVVVAAIEAFDRTLEARYTQADLDRAQQEGREWAARFDAAGDEL